MDLFEEHFNMLRKNEEIYKKYYMKKENGIIISAEEERNLCIKGEKILPSERVKYFMEVRSIYYWNIVNMELKNYSLPEWVICIKESVLLEYAIPILSRVLQEYPMLCGKDCEWQVLYEITKINKEFWDIHITWKVFFVKIICGLFSSEMEKNLIDTIPKEYLCQFRNFIG